MAIDFSYPIVETEPPSGKRQSLKRAFVNWLPIVGFWTLIAFIEAFQTYLKFLPEEYEFLIEGRPVTWFQWTLRNLPSWYILAVSTPFIFHLGRRFPLLTKRAKPLSLLAHLVFSLLFAFFYLWLEAFFARLFIGFPIDMNLLAISYSNRLVNNLHLIVTAYWAILGTGLAIDYYRKYRERETNAALLALRYSNLENQLVKAQLESLRMQLQPHFIFNTLNAVSGSIGENPEVARNMIADLSELLRYSLDSFESQTIPLEKEIEITKIYLRIAQQRFDGKLQVSVEVDPDNLEAMVPGFILQPLVENAVKHGISNTADIARIEIKALHIDNKLELSVADNGKGFTTDDSQPAGIGLGNIKERLEQLYGREHSFEVENPSGGGAVVKIVIPYSREEII